MFTFIREFCSAFAAGFVGALDAQARAMGVSRRRLVAINMWFWLFLASLLVLPCSAQAQVAGLCGPGKVCNVSRVRAGDGTAALPAYSWLLDKDTGFYRYTTDSIGVSTGGTNTARFLTTTLQLQNGSSNAPSMSFFANSATGFFHDGTGVGVSQAGVQIGSWTSSGVGTGSAGNGTALASFPTCNAGAQGRSQADSSSGGAWRYCTNGSGWRPIGPTILADDVTTYIPSATALLNVASGRITAPRQYFGASGSSSAWGSVQVRLDYATTLVAGVGAGNAVYTVYNLTNTAATTATVTVPCAGAAGTVTAGSSDSSLTFSGASQKDLEIRLTTNGCGTLPAVQITWGYTVTPAGS